MSNLASVADVHPQLRVVAELARVGVLLADFVRPRALAPAGAAQRCRPGCAQRRLTLAVASRRQPRRSPCALLAALACVALLAPEAPLRSPDRGSLGGASAGPSAGQTSASRRSTGRRLEYAGAPVESAVSPSRSTSPSRLLEPPTTSLSCLWNCAHAYRDSHHQGSDEQHHWGALPSLVVPPRSPSQRARRREPSLTFTPSTAGTAPTAR